MTNLSRFATAFASCGLAAAALSVPASALDLIVVDAALGSGADYAQITTAVQAAADGDTLLVRAGSYLPFSIQAKTLVIVAEQGANVLVHGTIEVRDIAASQHVVLHGLKTGTPGNEGLRARTNAGAVLVENCTLQGGSVWPVDGATAEDCSALLFVRCTLRGGQTTGGPGWGGSGGSGLTAMDSTVSVWGSVLVGEDGTWGDDIGGSGGDGAFLDGSFLFASGTEFLGADSGGADDDWDSFTGQLQCGYIPSGGAGVRIVQWWGAAAPEARLLDCVLVPGAGGLTTSVEGCPDGSPGLPLEVSDGVAEVLPGPQRSLRIPSPLHPGQPGALHFDGAPGDAVLALWSFAPGLVWLPEFDGTLGLAGNLGLFAVGALDPQGDVTLPLVGPPLSPLLPAITLHFQSLWVSSVGELVLGGASSLTLLGS